MAVLRESLIKLSGNNDVDEIPAESLTADEEMNGHCGEPSATWTTMSIAILIIIAQSLKYFTWIGT